MSVRRKVSPRSITWNVSMSCHSTQFQSRSGSARATAFGPPSSRELQEVPGLLVTVLRLAQRRVQMLSPHGLRTVTKPHSTSACIPS